MIAIACVSSNWGIGKDGDLLYHIPEDLKKFKEYTTGGAIVIGKKTLDSFPNGEPLPNRMNIIYTRDETLESTNSKVFVNDVYKLISLITHLEFVHNDSPFRIYLCGGGYMYNNFIDGCKSAYITKVIDDKEADVYCPNLDEKENWVCIEESDVKYHNGLPYKFCRYINANYINK